MGADMRAGIVAAVLLFGTSQAWAECAWVLWKERITIVDPSDKPWEVDRAEPTHQACIAAMTAALQSWERMVGHSKSVVITVSGTSIAYLNKAKEGAGASVWQYKCLPDTVDPREPKGK
jgi:hypothetical protein